MQSTLSCGKDHEFETGTMRTASEDIDARTNCETIIGNLLLRLTHETHSKAGYAHRRSEGGKALAERFVPTDYTYGQRCQRKSRWSSQVAQNTERKQSNFTEVSVN